MGEKLDAQTFGQRLIVESFDREFAFLHSRSCSIVERLDDETLYATADTSSHSAGESILRSAAELERTFGGITANLWDDPFEWTLPEHLSSRAKIVEHLGEVEALRQRAFTSFDDDSCLSKQVAAPAATQPLVKLLLGTLLRATKYQTQAAVYMQRPFQY